MSQNFRLFHVSNLSVRNFRIFLLMYTGSLTAPGAGFSCTGAWRADRSAGGQPESPRSAQPSRLGDTYLDEMAANCPRVCRCRRKPVERREKWNGALGHNSTASVGYYGVVVARLEVVYNLTFSVKLYTIVLMDVHCVCTYMPAVHDIALLFAFARLTLSCLICATVTVAQIRQNKQNKQATGHYEFSDILKTCINTWVGITYMSRCVRDG